jgi:hypothetical protein
MAATRIVQNVIRRPRTGDVVALRQVSIKASQPLFVNSGAVEIESTSYPVSDATGLWQAVLTVNNDADVTPQGTSYTVRELSGVIWTFVVPAGDPAVPVNLFDCLVDAPTNPTPIVAPNVAGIIDAMFATPAAATA